MGASASKDMQSISMAIKVLRRRGTFCFSCFENVKNFSNHYIHCNTSTRVISEGTPLESLNREVDELTRQIKEVIAPSPEARLKNVYVDVAFLEMADEITVAQVQALNLVKDSARWKCQRIKNKNASYFKRLNYKMIEDSDHATSSDKYVAVMAWSPDNIIVSPPGYLFKYPKNKVETETHRAEWLSNVTVVKQNLKNISFVKIDAALSLGVNRGGIPCPPLLQRDLMFCTETRNNFQAIAFEREIILNFRKCSGSPYYLLLKDDNPNWAFITQPGFIMIENEIELD
jgi:hypothetical protein